VTAPPARAASLRLTFTLTVCSRLTEAEKFTERAASAAVEGGTGASRAGLPLRSHQVDTAKGGAEEEGR
jgi:hypothetical protein